MYSSAKASSSAVVVPGRMRSPRSARVSTTTRPARAMRSISAGDLRIIIDGSSSSESCAVAVKRPPRKDAGSARSVQLRARLRTRRGGALQRPTVCEAGGEGPSSHRHVLQGPLDLGEDLVDGTVGVDPDEVALGAVVLHERFRLLPVERQARSNHLGRVVHPALECGTLRQALDADLLEELELEDDGQRAADLAQHLVERLGLGHRPWEAVE